MADLIDRQATMIVVGLTTDAINFNPKYVDAQGNELVAVVRCKDCKHNYHNMIPSGEAEHECTKCIELPITADFYCAWGEREEDAGEVQDS